MKKKPTLMDLNEELDDVYFWTRQLLIELTQVEAKRKELREALIASARIIKRLNKQIKAKNKRVKKK